MHIPEHMPNVKVGDNEYIVHNQIFRLSVLSVLDGNGILQQSQFYFGVKFLASHTSSN